jgi:deoxyribodipyrimidine photo-lyase
MQLYYFQRDLRIHDQPLLYKAMKQGPVIGLFVFETSDLTYHSKGFLKRGLFQRKFIYDSLVELKDSLKTLNIPLMVKIGHIKDEIESLMSTTPITHIYYETLLGSEEEKRYEAIKSLNIPITSSSFKTLYQEHELPFQVENLPFIFTEFKQKIEKFSTIRPMTNGLTPQNPLNINLDTSLVSELDLGIKDTKLPFEAGEAAGLKRLHYYLFHSKKVNGYKLTRNGMYHHDDSTKFSPYLAWGNLSPVMIMQELKRFETLHGSNISTYWVYFELLWRDFFHFTHLRYGHQVFYPNGLKGHSKHQTNEVFFSKWMLGDTGYPLVDANMKELLQTGFISNRGRQNVASFFVHDLKLHHLIGMDYFESQLIDFDLSSNTLNWLYVSGLGNDPRAFRKFNVTLQGKRYDDNGTYVDYYLPELLFVPKHLKYDVPFFDKTSREAYGITHYPLPIVKVKHHE